MSNFFKINKSYIGQNYPIYFIADIAANHDGDINRAIKLIKLAKESGANAVKFQHHNVKKYVNEKGFLDLGSKFSHQKKWKKSVYQVYKDAEVPIDWTPTLKNFSDKIGIDFFSTPYDLDMVDHLDKYVSAYKIGSGDINWMGMIEKVANKKKPIFIAAGASTFDEVKNVVNFLQKKKIKFCLMQCNTNYTGSINNYNYINLNVLKTFSKKFKNIILGLSDHTANDETVLGACSLGIKAVEKHFTDDIKKSGPDHSFSMDPFTWKKMVASTRLLEKALGDGIKKVEKNEKETLILQRRSVRAIFDMKKGEKLSIDKIEFQRPCPSNAIKPNDLGRFLNKNLKKNLKENDYLTENHFK
jgi:N-acetylneuraminate synthase